MLSRFLAYGLILTRQFNFYSVPGCFAIFSVQETAVSTTIFEKE